ncbi:MULTISPECIES: lysozyme [unclassified Enterobacter]|uniref:lysozyme n=1 Tax=unclassified Enterobacter TaxID=2608935 RepID=UPI0003ED15CB|nr:MULTISPECIES: lysozyme [unclassified Enterobacter]EWG71297.1 Phage-related lysozyme (muraminidase) [Enterobacter sp. DC4]EWG73198.1 Phage-related lysozyme (muraminidase) [Enterobacter sp. DC3]
MKGHALKISSAAIALIKKHQGLSLEKYCDENGLWVIGYGHVIRDRGHFHGPITPAEAEDLLHDDIQLCEALLRESVTRPLTQQQHDALVMMVFSFGEMPSLPNAIFQAFARV